MRSGKGVGGGRGRGGAGAEIPEHVSADDREMRTTCVAWVRAAPTPTAPPLCLSFSRWLRTQGQDSDQPPLCAPFALSSGLGGGVGGI